MKKAEIKRRKRVIPAPSPFVMSTPPPGMTPSASAIDARDLKVSLDFAETYPSRPLDMAASAANGPAIAAATAAAAAAAATVTANASEPNQTLVVAHAPPSIDFTFFNERESRISGPMTPRKRPRDPDDEDRGRDVRHGADVDADAACGHQREGHTATTAADAAAAEAADRADARLDPLLRAADAVAVSERELLRQKAELMRLQLAEVEEAIARLDRQR
jgi:hypothetical protein